MNRTHILLIAMFQIFTINLIAQDLYDMDIINSIEIRFPFDNWDYKLDSLVALGEEERLEGSVFINGIQFDSVGIRYKGNSSYNPENAKNPLNIKLDHIIEDQLYEGYGTLKLANCFKDPSFIREVLSYEIARKYMPASKANFINVYINGELIGLYSNVQSVDKSFLDYHFCSDDNAFFKGEIIWGPPSEGCPDGPIQVWGYLGANTSCYQMIYELRSDGGWDELIDFCDTLNNYPSQVESILNVDRHLWMLAFDNLMVNLDAPINFAHNFYLYKDGSDRFNPIIWDLNENFGAFTQLGNMPLNIFEMQHLDPYLNLGNPDYPIIDKILSNPSYRKQYVSHYKTILEENFTNNWYLTRAQEIQNSIDSCVQADVNKFYSDQDFRNNLNYSAGPADRLIVGIEELMDSRVLYINSLPDFRRSAPEISNVSNSPTEVTSHSAVWILAEVENAISVQLAFRSAIDGKYEKVEMFDDGNHNDSSANDNIYGAYLATGSTDIQYYIYAENNDAAAFSPERAEYEYYKILLTSNVVINEFMAINDKTAMDQDEEYDDWIELYNNSSEAISLKGYFLSDDVSEPAKWTFPDTSIAARDYLIIWVDDEEQDGLHTSFKLSGSGEVIVLSDSTQSVIDQINFGVQTEDISTGRYPNGTGMFVLMAPTFSAWNDNSLTDIDPGIFEVPYMYKLNHNCPNPFNPETIIVYELPVSGRVELNVYDISGRKISSLVNSYQEAGRYVAHINASTWDSGVYLYVLESGNVRLTEKMILLK